MSDTTYRKYVNGEYIDMTAEEITAMEAEAQAQEAAYWAGVDYGDAVNAEIRKRYSESEEFALLRQKDEKPEEYAAYFGYCEQCKQYVREKKGGT